MIRAPKIIDCKLLTRLTGIVEPGEAWRVVEKDRQEHDEGSAEERTQNAAETANDDHEQDLEGAVDLERAGLDGARVDKGPHRAGDAAVKRAQGKGEQLGAQRADADNFGGNVHVTDRHPGAPDAAADYALGSERKEDDDGQDKQILRPRVGLGAGDVKAAEKRRAAAR